MKTLIVLRNDLRIHDNVLFKEAEQEASACAILVCLPRSEPACHALGFPQRGVHREIFLRECLLDLSASLRARGHNLSVTTGPWPATVAWAAVACGAERVLLTREWASDELEDELRLQSLLVDAGIQLKVFEQNALFAFNDLNQAFHRPPRTFSDFRRVVEAKARPESPLPDPCHWPQSLPLAVEGVELEVAEYRRDPRAVLIFRGGEGAGLQRLNHYLFGSQAVRHYKQTRNGLLGPDFSSKLSPWLAHGCLSPRRVIAELSRFEKDFERNESTYWLFFELLWREFFRFMAFRLGKDFFSSPAMPPVDPRTFRAWSQGRTGCDFVDANMRELNATGFMSNRGRQNVASYWIHDLGQDWRVGAAYFESVLMDYDVYSNWGNWAYIAGLRFDPRGGRPFNVADQALRYDPEGIYVRTWLGDDPGIR